MDLPEPITRKEMYLNAIARNGGGGGGGSSTLSGLTDVDISNPSDGQTLVYNATSGKWENGAGGGGGVLVVNITGTFDPGLVSGTMDKTFAEIAASDATVFVAEDHGVKIYFTPAVIYPPSGEDAAEIALITFAFSDDAEKFTFVADTVDDYPAFSDE